ncbi:C4-dicarboxylate-binding periplasmic protein precursor [Oligella ureolytica]|uniref:C4-dicarboxylate-binding periplasmic protein n=1 Tax=Oligella ureolytica TaxID=90244 RepID=A0A378XGP4_9BURK|nr:TRAP transporter substrate-binding protein DctP [Oligella ureolytica]QPT41168.1 TRAP transporter substrate-binding protein DctP [Oligella ureolytica]SUA53928.1 C4-dicarboxylate-binding periplasmic protein precursor [Oligella ureolytica]SUA55372.1 C4-dicarboxylate-binding periplasmic protein precursor [Oligella ureolytica]
MKLKLLASAAATLMAFAMPAHAEIPNIELRVGDSLPPDHIISQKLTQAWFDAVESKSNGKIKIKHFPAEQSGKAKDLLSLTQTGVLDIGYVGPAYVADKMPLSGVAELPGMFTTSCQATNAYWSMAQEGGYFFENEYKQNKIRPLFLTVLPPYQLMISNKKNIESLKDFGGLKIRAAGGAQELTLNQIDAVAVKMAPPEIYESMSRGTIDGALLPFISIESYKLSPRAHSSTLGANFGAVIVTYSISERKWRSLPKEVQEILAQAGDEATKQACVSFDEEEQKVYQQLKEQGVNFIQFEGADKEKIESVMKEVSQNWAERLDKRNKPGTETLNKFTEALATQM